MAVVASHFSMVGFQMDLSNPTVFAEETKHFVQTCTLSGLTANDIACAVRDMSGGEIHIGLRRGADGSMGIQAVDPAYTGEGRLPVEVVSDVSGADDKPFDTTVTAHFAGEATPLVFELADPREAADFKPGAKLDVDIAAFSFQPQLFADAAAFEASQDKQGSKVRLAPNFFIPSGMFFLHAGGAMPDDAKLPVAYADFAGTVLKTELKTNTVGGGTFWWALVQTYDRATIDVVMDSSTISGGDPKPGEIIAGRFWLSARVLHNGAGQ
jgi:hypothetical protein